MDVQEIAQSIRPHVETISDALDELEKKVGKHKAKQVLVAALLISVDAAFQGQVSREEYDEAVEQMWIYSMIFRAGQAAKN